VLYDYRKYFVREIVEPTPPPLPLKMTSTSGSMYVPIYGPVMMEDAPSDTSYERAATWKKSDPGTVT